MNNRDCVDCGRKVGFWQHGSMIRCHECWCRVNAERNALRYGSTQMKKQLVRERGKRCQHCGKAGPVDMAHFVPVSAKGPLVPENLILLCRDCHLTFDGRKRPRGS